MLAYFLQRRENFLYYLPSDTRIISQKTTFIVISLYFSSCFASIINL